MSSYGTIHFRFTDLTSERIDHVDNTVDPSATLTADWSGSGSAAMLFCKDLKNAAKPIAAVTFQPASGLNAHAFGLRVVDPTQKNDQFDLGVGVIIPDPAGSDVEQTIGVVQKPGWTLHVQVKKKLSSS